MQVLAQCADTPSEKCLLPSPLPPQPPHPDAAVERLILRFAPKVRCERCRPYRLKCRIPCLLCVSLCVSLCARVCVCACGVLTPQGHAWSARAEELRYVLAYYEFVDLALVGRVLDVQT